MRRNTTISFWVSRIIGTLATATVLVTGVVPASAALATNTENLAAATAALSPAAGAAAASPAPTSPSTAVLPTGTGTSTNGKFRLTKTANFTELPHGGGDVTYTYTVQNLSPGDLVLVSRSDDRCGNIEYVSGLEQYWDPLTSSYEYRLPVAGTATFTCETTVRQTTTNTASFTFADSFSGSGEPVAPSTAVATETVVVEGSYPDVCHTETMWGVSSNGQAREYNIDGTLTGRSIKYMSTYSLDIAISPDGESLVGMTRWGNMVVYHVPTGDLDRWIMPAGLPAFATFNSLSFGENGILYLGGSDGYVYGVDILTNTLFMPDAFRVTTTPVSGGFAGDFVTLANGDMLALANVSGTNATRFVLFPKDPNGGFLDPVEVGQPQLAGGGAVVAYGGAFVNGSIYLAGSDGHWYQVHGLPDQTSNAHSTYLTTRVTTGGSAPAGNFSGGTSVQEGNSQCSSDTIDIRKLPGAVTGPDANGVYTVTYQIQAVNSGSLLATYGPITDYASFDGSLTILRASWSGPGTGNQVVTQEGGGPFWVTTANTQIPAGATHTYTMSMEFTRLEEHIPTLCDGTAGRGLFNAAWLPDGDESLSLTNNMACVDLLVPRLDVAKTGVVITGPDANDEYTATYTVTVTNSGTGATTYGPLVDTTGFDSAITVQGASWTGQASGTATGTSFTIAGAGTQIAAGTTHQYNVSIQYSVEPGTLELSECGATPQSGEGLYNSVSLPAGQEDPARNENGQLIDNNFACMTPPTPPYPSISVVKTANPTSVTGSGVVTYNYTVTNTGNEPLGNVSATDNRCDLLVLISGDSNSNGVIDLDETWVYMCSTLLRYPQNAPEWVNEVTVTAVGTTSLESTTNTDTATVAVNPTPANIDVTKIAGAVTGPNENGVYAATYTLRVVNTGQAAGTYGPLTDTPGFDTALTVQGASWTGPASSSATGQGPFEVAPAGTAIPGGGTHEYAVTVYFTYSDPAVSASSCAGQGTGLYNEVALPGDDTPLDNSACVEPPEAPNPQLALLKHVDDIVDVNNNNVTDAGDTIQYSFTVTNVGNVPLYSPTISDESLGLIDFACGTVLQPGSQQTCVAPDVYTVTTADQAVGAVVNTAVAEADAPGDPGPTVSSPQSSTSTPTASLAYLNVVKSLQHVASAIDPATGEFDVTYAITVTNSGDTPTTYGPLQDQPFFAENIEAVSGSWGTTTQLDDGPYELAPAGTSIAGHTTHTYQITIHARYLDTSTASSCDGAGTGLYNAATLTGEHGPQTDNSACVAPPAPPTPSIELQKTDAGINDDNGNSKLDANDSVNYTFQVSNTGNIALQDIAVTDQKFTAQGTAITCNKQTLAPGESTMCWPADPLALSQADIDAGSIENTAQVTATPIIGDEVSDQSAAVVQLPTDPSISLAKTAIRNDYNNNGRTDLGDSLTYQFTVTNTGSRTIETVTINDPLLTAAGISVVCPSDPIAPQSSITCEADDEYYISAADDAAGQVFNSATAQGRAANDDEATATAYHTEKVYRPSILVLKEVDTTYDNNTNGRTDAGDEITYSFTVTNTGNTTLNSIEIIDPAVSTHCDETVLEPEGTTTCYSDRYLVTVDDANAGSVANTATVSGQPVDGTTTLGDPVTDQSTATASTSNPSVTINKSHTLGTDTNNNGRTDAGDTINYTFVVTNTGNTALTGIAVTDPKVGTVTCDSDTLAIGGSTECSAAPYVITDADALGTSFSNTATVTAQPPLGSSITETDTDVVEIERASITLAKTHQPPQDLSGDGRVSAGDKITYNFLVTNTGNVVLNNIAIDEGLEVQEFSCPGTSLAPGTSMNCSAVYYITEADALADGVNNTATVTANPVNGTPVTATASDTQFVSRAELTFEKIPGPINDRNANGRTDAGDEFTYTFAVENTGNVTISGLTVTDPMLAASDITVTCDTGTLQPGQTTTCRSSGPYRITAADAAAGEVTNEATITGQPPRGQQITATDSATIPVHTASMDITKTHQDWVDVNENGRVDAGDTVHYTFTILNTGNTTLTGGTILDNRVGALTCDVTVIAPNETATCNTIDPYVITDVDVALGAVENRATASGQPTDGTNPLGNRIQDSATDELPTLGAAMEVTKTITSVTDSNNNGRVDTDDIINYKIVLTNTGQATLKPVTVIDESATSLTCPGSLLTTGLAAGESATCTATHKITFAEATSGSFTNTVEVEAQPVDSDGVGVGNVIELSATATQATSTASIELEKIIDEVEDTYPNGRTGVLDTIHYEFVVTNTGTTPLTNVQVIDPLTGAVTCPGTTLAVSETMTCTASYVITEDRALTGSIDNEATASGRPNDGSKVVTDTSSASEPTYVGALRLDKRIAEIIDGDGSPRIGPGDQIKYEFVVTHYGFLTIEDIALTDDFLTGVSCPGDTLNQGESMICTADPYVITPDDGLAGYVANNASVSGQPIYSDGSDAGAPWIEPASLRQDLQYASIELTKTVTEIEDTVLDGRVGVGDTMHFKFVITNDGAETLKDVTLTDPFLQGSEYASDFDCGAATLGPGFILAPAQSVVCTATYVIQMTDADAGQVHNVASVTARPIDGQGAYIGEDSVTDTSETKTQASFTELVLEKRVTVNQGPNERTDAGDTITYEFDVTNNSTLSVIDLVVIDQMVGTVTCPSNTIGPGETVTCTAAPYTITEADAALGVVHNAATASAQPIYSGEPIGGLEDGDPVGDRIAATASVSVPAYTAGVTLEKRVLSTTDVDGNGRICENDKVVYEFEITNTGNTALINVELTDPKLASAGVAITCPSQTIDPGDTMVCESGSYVITNEDEAAWEVSNEATVEGQPATTDATPVPLGTTVSTQDELTFPVQHAELSLEKTFTTADTNDTGRTDYGDTIHYTFTVTNEGNLPIHNISVSDDLVGAVHCPQASLDPNESMECFPAVDYVISLDDIRTDQDGNAFIDNQATVTGKPSVGIAVSQDDDVTVPLHVASIALDKTVVTTDKDDDGRISLDDEVVYWFKVTNTGKMPLSSITITDELITNRGLTINCPSVTTLDPGSSMDCNSTVMVLTEADVQLGSMTNTATVSGQPLDELGEPEGREVTASDFVTGLTANASIQMVKSIEGTTDANANGRVDAGDTINYKFAIQNTGNLPLNDVELVDENATVSCPLDSLAAGQRMNCTGTHIITEQEALAGTVENTAEITAQPMRTDRPEETYGKVVSTTSTASQQTQVAALTLDKSAGPPVDANESGRHDAGDTITYTFTVENTGNVALSNVTIDDATVNLTGYLCVTQLPVGATDSCSFVKTLTQGDLDSGEVANTATATGVPPVGTPVVSAPDQTLTQLTAAPALRLVKTASAPVDTDNPPNGAGDVGDTLSYTFTVFNDGNTTLTDITVSDPLLELTDHECVAQLAPGQSGSCTVLGAYELTQEDVDRGYVTNTATAEAMSGTTEVQAPAATTTATIEPITNLVLTKYAADPVIVGGGDVVQPNDTIQYSFTVTNNSNVTVENITIDDELLALTGWDCHTGTLAPGASVSCNAPSTYAIPVSALDQGHVTNTAVAHGVTPADATIDSAPATTETLLTAAPSIELTKQTIDPGNGVVVDVDEDGRHSVGDTIGYRFTVENTGNVTLSNIALFDLKLGLHAYTCGTTTLAPGANTTCDVTGYEITVADLNAGVVENEATVLGTPPTGPFVMDEASVEVGLQAEPGIELDKTAGDFVDLTGNNQVDPNEDTIPYSFTVTNTGNVTLTDIAVTDPLLGSVSCLSQVLDPGGTTTCTAAPYVVTIADVDGGSVTNIATVTGTPPTGPAVSDDDTVIKEIPRRAEIDVTKTIIAFHDLGAPEFSVGDEIDYRIVVMNTGNVTLSDIEVVDTLQPTGTNPDVTCPGTSLDAESQMTCTLTYELTQDDVDAGYVDNTVTVTGTPPVGAGDDVTATDEVRQNGTRVAAVTIDKATGPATDMNSDGVIGIGETTGTATDVDGDGMIEPNETVTFTFWVTNTGNTTLSDIEVNDPRIGVEDLACGAPLAPGETARCEATYTLTQAEVDAGGFTNTATVTARPPAIAADPDPTPVTDTDDSALEIEHAPSIGLVGVATPADEESFNTRPEAGDEIIATAVVTNTGNVTLTNIRPLVDLLSGIVCPKDTLAADESMTCTAGSYFLTQADINRGSVVGTGAMIGTPPTGPEVQASTSTVVPLQAVPELDFEKTSQLIGESSVGSRIRYTFTAENTGNVTLTNLRINDSRINLTNFLCAPTVAPGQEVTCSVDYQVTQADINAGLVENTATITATLPALTTFDTESNTEETTLSQTTGLTLTKTVRVVQQDGNLTNDLGDVLTYSFKVTNTGNVELAPVLINDPALGLTDFECTSSLAGGATYTCAAPAAYNHVITQDDVDAGIVTNTATASGTTANAAQQTVTSNEASTNVTTQANPALNITKELTATNYGANDLPDVGELLEYTFTVTNTGNVTLSDVTVVDERCVPGTLSLDSGDTNGDGKLQLDETWVFTCSLELTQADINDGAVTNVAVARAERPNGDPDDPTDDVVSRRAYATTLLEHNPELTVTKTATPTMGVEAGDEVTYTFTVTNTGNVTLTDAAVADPMFSVGADAIGAVHIPGTHDIALGCATSGEAACPENALARQPDGVYSVAVYLPAGDYEYRVTEGGTWEHVYGAGGAPGGAAITYTVPAPGDIVIFWYNPETHQSTNSMLGTTIDVGSPISCTPSNPYPGQALNSLDSGQSATCTTRTYVVTQEDVDAGVIVNTITAVGLTYDFDRIFDTDTTVVEADSRGLVLTMAAELTDTNENGTADTDEKIEYTFTVFNTGNVNLSDISFPATGMLCTPEYVSGDVPRDEVLQVGEKWIYKCSYTVTQEAMETGEIVNTATVSGKTPEQTDVVSGEVTRTLKSGAAPEFTLEKKIVNWVYRADPTQVSVGDQFTYSFTVANTGNTTLQNVVINDPTLGLTNFACVGSLALGADHTCTSDVVVTVTQDHVDAGQILSSQANARADWPGSDPSDPDDDITAGPASVTLPIPAAPSVTLDKVAATSDTNGDGVIGVGDQITYSFTATNTGNVTLTNVVITDPLLGLTNFACVATLAPGSNATCSAPSGVTITQAHMDAGSFVNTATVSAARPGSTTPVTNTGTDTVTFPVTPGLTIDKTAVVTDVNGSGANDSGDTIEYTFTVTNTGNVTMASVTIDDADLGVSGLPCATSLAPGTSASCVAPAPRVIGTPDIDVGAILNTASATGVPVIGAAVTDVTVNVVPIRPMPRIELTKTATTTDINGNGMTDVGDTVAFTFTVTNVGDSPIARVLVDDPDLGIADLLCATDLDVGASASCPAGVDYTLTQADVDRGHVTNVATATGYPGSTPPAPEAGLDLAVTAVLTDTNANGWADVDETIEYGFVVVNTGQVEVDVTVSDPMLAARGVSINCPQPKLAPGAAQRCTASYVVTGEDVAAGSVDSAATALGSGGGQNVTSAEYRTSTLTTEPPAPPARMSSMRLFKTAVFTDTNGDGVANAGETIRFEFTVVNTGPLSITDLVVSDGLVAVTCPASNLDPGETTTCVVDYPVTAQDIGFGPVGAPATATGMASDGNVVVSNMVTTLTLTGGIPTHLPSATGTAQVPTTHAPAVDIVKHATAIDVGGDGLMGVGDEIVYSFTVTNIGNMTLAPVTVTDPMLGLTDFECATSLAPGASVTCAAPEANTYIVQVADQLAQTVVNTAEVTGGTVSGLTANTDSTTTLILEAPGLAMTKTATGNDTNGDGVIDDTETITFTFELTNTGNVKVSNIWIDDPLLIAAGVPVTCPKTALAVAESMTCWSEPYPVTAEQAQLGVVANTATALGEVPGGDPLDPADDVTVSGSVTTPVQVHATVPLSRAMPRTGADAIPVALLALSLLATGGILILAGRRLVSER